MGKYSGGNALRKVSWGKLPGNTKILQKKNSMWRTSAGRLQGNTTGGLLPGETTGGIFQPMTCD